MRSSKIGRMVVRAIVVGLLAVGAWFASTMVAHAENDWQIGPTDGVPADLQPAPTETVGVDTQ